MSVGSGQILLSEEEGSAAFGVKTIEVTENVEVTIGRGTKEILSKEDNAIFKSRVLSKDHGMFVYKDGQFYIRDLGSSNGTFINNIRISKGGDWSGSVLLYSQDIIRFGTEKVDRKENEKCVICRLRLIHPSGEPEKIRPPNENVSSALVELQSRKKRRVKFNEIEEECEFQNETEDKADTGLTEQVEILEKRIKRKNNEIKNMSDNLHQLREENEELILKQETGVKEQDNLRREQETLLLEIQQLKQQNLAFSDQLAVQAKEELDNVQVLDLQCELQEAKKLNEGCKEENWLLKEKLRCGAENLIKKDHEIEELMKSTESLNKKLDLSHRRIHELEEEVDSLTGLVTRADEIVQEKDRELIWIQDILDKHNSHIKEKDNDYINLKHCMTEESETVHQIENEMIRLIQVIQDEQQSSSEKDKIIKACSDEISKMRVKVEEKETELGKLRTTAETNIGFTIAEKNKQMDKIAQEADEVKAKAEKAKEETDKAKEEAKKAKNEAERFKNDANLLRIELERLSQSSKSISEKEEKLSENQEYKKQIQNLREELIKQKEELKNDKEIIQNLTKKCNETRAEVEPPLVDMKTLKTRLIREQEQNTELENELIMLRLSNEELRVQNKNLNEIENTEPDCLKSILKRKDTEIQELKNRIVQEQLIVAHVQITQEEEIVSKEKEIQYLTSLLNSTKGKDLLNRVSVHDAMHHNNITAAGANDADDDDDDATLSFHDAVSDEEEYSPDFRYSDIDELSLG